MGYKTVNLDSNRKQYEKFLATNTVDESILDDNYKTIREYCLKITNEIEVEIYKNKNVNRLHEFDMRFGIELYEFLNQQPDFDKKYESDYAFWRYLATFVIPDIVSKRWGIEKKDHFYKKATAVYPYQVYWYINMSWQGTKDKTIEVLKFNKEDQILQLVDRPSSIGVNLNLYRLIMKKVSQIPPKERQNKFRAIMICNTGKLVNIRPELYPNGCEGYVEMLFSTI